MARYHAAKMDGRGGEPMSGLRGLARQDYERKAEEFVASLAHKPLKFRGTRYLGTSSMTAQELRAFKAHILKTGIHYS